MPQLKQGKQAINRTILLELEEAIITKNASWLIEISKMIDTLVYDILEEKNK